MFFSALRWNRHLREGGLPFFVLAVCEENVGLLHHAGALHRGIKVCLLS